MTDNVEVAPGSELPTWGLDVTVAGHSHRFAVDASLALWLTARGAELQRGESMTVQGAVEALVAELIARADQGDSVPMAAMVALCTGTLAEALDGWTPERLFARAWEQTAAGAPAPMLEALPEFLPILEAVLDRRAPESVTLDVRLTVYAAVAVWAGLLADRDHRVWALLAERVGADASGRLWSLDGQVALRLDDAPGSGE